MSEDIQVKIDDSLELPPRKKIELLNRFLRTVPGHSEANEKSELELGCKYEHTFTPGLYIRKMFLPKDIIFVTKVHKTRHPYFIMQGDVTVYLGGETVRIKAPFCGITEPLTQRALVTHSDTIWITVHATDKTDVEEIVKDIVADSFDDIEVKQLEKSGGVV